MSKIEWTGKTWNPTTGCNKVSPGCRGCYAEVMHKRLKGMGQEKYQQDFLDGVVTHESELEYPFTIKKPTTFFVDSMSDLFHVDVPFEFIAKVFIVMALNPQHTFQLLTKRPDRALEYFKEYEYNGFGDDRTTDELVSQFDHLLYDKKTHQLSKHITDAGWHWDRYFDDDARLIFENCDAPLKNVWIGTSVENQKYADERIPLLLQIPAAVRFLSCEPLLGLIDLVHIDIQRASWIDCLRGLSWKGDSGGHDHGKVGSINWVIAGGESGHNARPVNPNWIRSLRYQCSVAKVPFFFKQWGEYVVADQMPQELYRALRRAEATHKIGQMVMDDGLIYHFHKVGKSKSGNLLDGKQYLEFPKTNS